MHKGVRTEMIPATIRKANEAGIFTVGSLIFPAPGDSAATARETLALLAREKPGAVTMQAPVIAPRTEWFEASEKYGIAFKNRDRYLREAMVWKLNLDLPTVFWPSLPVSVDGRSYKKVLAMTFEFVRMAEQRQAA